VSWEDQGRQYHMWFGHGTAPVKAKDASDDGIFGRNGLAQRIQAVAHGAVGALPQAVRARAAAQYDAGNLERLSEAMTAWSRGTKLGVDEFAERFFGRTADDPAVKQLHRAALSVGLARSHAELREASDQLADAMQAIGLDRWPQFLADAQERARDPATVAAVDKSRQPPDPGKDAIRPVYPLETAIRIGVAGSAAAVARAAGGAILRQLLPRKSPPVYEGPKTIKTTKFSLPPKPDDLLRQGWKEITHPKELANGRRVFVNPETNQTVEFDKGRPGEPAWRGQDHYHIRNPDATGKGDKYLSRDGLPVPDGSKRSHIPADR